VEETIVQLASRIILRYLVYLGGLLLLGAWVTTVSGFLGFGRVSNLGIMASWSTLMSSLLLMWYLNFRELTKDSGQRIQVGWNLAMLAPLTLIGAHIMVSLIRLV
jgi:hypothetical protein